MTAGAFAQSNVTVYGSMDAGVAYVNNVGGKSVTRLDQGTMQPDRIGFRGTEDLGEGLKANYQLEAGFFPPIPAPAPMLTACSTVPALSACRAASVR
ncbi:porin [Undibacterium arcticum]